MAHVGIPKRVFDTYTVVLLWLASSDSVMIWSRVIEVVIPHAVGSWWVNGVETKSLMMSSLLQRHVGLLVVREGINSLCTIALLGRRLIEGLLLARNRD